MGKDGRAVTEEGKDEEGKVMAEVDDGGAEVGDYKANVGVREASRAMAKMRFAGLQADTS